MKRKHKLQTGLFDEELRLQKLSAKSDPLESLNKKIQWEEFRPIIEDVLRKEPKAPGGRPLYDVILKLKMLIMQRYATINHAVIKSCIALNVVVENLLKKMVSSAHLWSAVIFMSMDADILEKIKNIDI
jgi:hypothetical protein